MNDPSQSVDNTPQPATGDERVSTLVGDRLCLDCGYNLVGQPVLREQHYSMLIVRCPECGTVAALQEYPRLGKWANRWALLLAAAYLFAVLSAIYAFSDHLRLTAGEQSWEASEPLARWIGDHYFEWLRENDPAAFDLLVEQESEYGESFRIVYQIQNPLWLQSHDPDDLLAEAGGALRMMDWAAFGSMLGSFLFTTAFFGMALAIAFLRFRLWKRFALGLAILLFAAVLDLAQGWSAPFDFYQSLYDFRLYAQTSPQLLAVQAMHPFTLAITLCIASVPLALGLLFGRVVARLVVRTALPPRQAGAFAFLWTCDGKQPPKPL